MARKKTLAAKAEEIQLTVRLTPEGVQEARRQLDDLETKAKARAWRELRTLMDDVQAKNTYASEEEVMADVEEAREALWRKRQAQAR